MVRVRGSRQTNFHFELGNGPIVYEGVRFDNLVVPVFVISQGPAVGLLRDLRLFGRCIGDWIDFDNVRPADRSHGSQGDRLRPRPPSRVGDSSTSTRPSTSKGGRLFTANVPQMNAGLAVQYPDLRARHPPVHRYPTANQDLYEDMCRRAGAATSSSSSCSPTRSTRGRCSSLAIARAASKPRLHHDTDRPRRLSEDRLRMAVVDGFYRGSRAFDTDSDTD